MSGRQHTRAYGFTLVELLVALSLSTILILAAHSAFGLGLMLWRRVEAPRQFEEQGRRVLTLMRAELAGLYWPNVEQEKVPPVVYHEQRGGSQWKFSFFTTTPSHYRGLPPGRCVRVTYEYRTPGNGKASGAVLIRRAALAAGEKEVSEPVADVLAEGLTGCKVTLQDAKGEPWQAEGKGRQAPPAMVAVEMRWPDVSYAAGRTRPVEFQARWPVTIQAALLPDE